MVISLPRNFWLGIVASGLLLGGLYWHVRQRNEDRQAQFRELAWGLRRGDAEQGLTRSQRAFLHGDFLEAMRRLEKPLSKRDQALQNLCLRCLLYDVPWPKQVLQTFHLDPKRGSDLLFRVVNGGYARDRQRVTLDVFRWDDRDWEELELPGLDEAGKNSPPPAVWAEITDIRELHLDRKDEQASQVLLVGKGTDGKVRTEIFYGLRQWKRWVLIGGKAPQVRDNRVVLPGGKTYKLVDDEWVSVGKG